MKHGTKTKSHAKSVEKATGKKVAGKEGGVEKVASKKAASKKAGSKESARKGSSRAAGKKVVAKTADEKGASQPAAVVEVVAEEAAYSFSSDEVGDAFNRCRDAYPTSLKRLSD